MSNSFLPIENLLAGKAGPPVMLEYSLDRTLCEQLIWRRGAHLWKDEAAILETLSEGARLSHFGAAVLPLSLEQERAGFPVLDMLLGKLPDKMGVICGLETGPAKRICSGANARQILEEFPAAVHSLADKAGAVFIQDDFTAVRDDGLKQALFQCLESACGAAHRAGRKVIWTDRSEKPIPVEQIAQLPFDGLQLSPLYNFSTAEAIRRYGARFCLLGRTDFSRLLTLKPMDIIEDFAALWELCGGKGYIFGSGNIDGSPIPYLTFLSMLSAWGRLNDNSTKYMQNIRNVSEIENTLGMISEKYT